MKTVTANGHAEACPSSSTFLGKARHAQTSVQLYEQLQQQGFPTAALTQIRAALYHATVLFAGRAHGSGRSYLAHGVGIASVLARLEVSTDLIVAGLLHGAYLRGDFGSWRIPLRWQRPRLRAHVGAPVELLVFNFHQLPWDPAAVEALSRRAAALTPAERDAVLVRLADDLDNLLNAAVLYHDDAVVARASVLRKGPSLIVLAEALGYPALGEALREALDVLRDRDVPAELRSHIGLKVIPPASATLRAEASLTRALMRRLRATRARLAR